MGSETILQSNGWQTAALSRICCRVTDGSHFSPTPQRNGKPIANVKDLRAGYVDISSCTRITSEDFDALVRTGCDVSNKDVLLSKDGTIGKVVVYTQDDELVALSSIAILRPSDRFDPFFLGQALQSDDVARQIDVFTSGSALRRLVLRDVNQLQIPTPPVLVQRAIAAILDAADEAIAKTEALIAKLKAIKQGLLYDLLTRGLDENGELRDPERYPEQFKDSSLGRIPIAWDVLAINDLAVHVGSGITPTGGSNVYKSEGILFIRSQNVTFEGLLLDDVAYIDKRTHQMMARSEVFAHDILLNITGASIGRCCPVPEDLGPANVNQHVCAIRIAKPRREDAVFLSAVLASFIGQHQIDRLNAGSNRQGLNYQQLRSFLVPWPIDDAERTTVAARVELAESRIRAEQNYLSKLKAIKRGLMQDLLTGHVRVNIKQEIKEK